MKWNLTVNVDRKPSFTPLDHRQTILSLGSCFSEHIGNIMTNRQWNICNNPFGILYNPSSIYDGFIRILSDQDYQIDDLMEFNDLFLSLDHHGSFSGSDANKVLASINEQLLTARQMLKDASTVIVTFGTAYHYIH